MKYIETYLDKIQEFAENILYQGYKLTISDINGKLTFAYETIGTKYKCKIGVVEGCALILDGTNDTNETKNIPLGEKDKKGDILPTTIHDTLRWLWNAGKYSEGKDLLIAGVRYYDLKKSALEYDLVSHDFVRRFGQRIIDARKNAVILNDIMKEYRKIKWELREEFQIDKDASKFGL
jgi:hypothetical protein